MSAHVEITCHSSYSIRIQRVKVYNCVKPGHFHRFHILYISVVVGTQKCIEAMLHLIM